MRISTEGRRDRSNTGNVISCQPHEERKEEKNLKIVAIAFEFSYGSASVLGSCKIRSSGGR